MIKENEDYSLVLKDKSYGRIDLRVLKDRMKEQIRNSHIHENASKTQTFFPQVAVSVNIERKLKY